MTGISVKIQHTGSWLHFSWNVTNVCNLACPHCYLDAVRRPASGLLSLEEGFKFIDELVEVGREYQYVNLVFSGGEPLARRPEIYELIAYAREKGIVPVMGTNGTMITEEVAEKLAESGLTSAGVSIDSVRPEKHDMFRGIEGAWEKAVRGIKNLVEHGISAQIHFTLTPWNWMELKDVVELAVKLRARAVRVFGVVETGRAEYLVREEFENIPYEKVWMDIVKLTREYDVPIRPTCMPMFERFLRSLGETLSPGEMLRLRTYGCMAGINYGRLNYNGDVTPCPYLPLKVGNVREESFVKMWKESPILKSLRSRNNLRGRCRICPYREVCGGCRARAYSSNRDYLGDDPFCKFDPLSLAGVNA